MRLIKMLGLVAAGALIAMAFVGASSASADSACLVDPPGGAQGECPKEKIWTGPIIGLSPEARFVLEKSETKCKSEFLADWVKNEGAKIGVLYLILTFTFSECKGECKAAFAENLPWNLLVLMAAGASGQEHAFLFEDPGWGQPSILLESCLIEPLVLNCLYQFNKEVLLNYVLEKKEEKPLAGALAFNTVMNWAGDDKLCPKLVTFIATYLIYEDVEKKEGGELFFTALP